MSIFNIRARVTKFAELFKAQVATTTFEVVVTDERGKFPATTETVKAATVRQAAEVAAAQAAARRMKTTTERSWRLLCLVGDAKFSVVAQALVKAEIA